MRNHFSYPFLQPYMTQAKCDETYDGNAEGEEFDAPHGVRVVQRDVDDARHVAGKQRGGNRDIEEYIDGRDSRCRCDSPNQQVAGKGDREVRKLVRVETGRHMITSFVSILYIPYRFFITISEYIYNNSRIGDKILLRLQKGIKFLDKLQFVITRNLFVEYRAAGQGSTNASLRCFAKNIFCL